MPLEVRVSLSVRVKLILARWISLMSLIRGALMKGGGLEWRRKWQFTPGFLPGKLENSYLVHTNLCNEFPSSSWSLELICSKREYHIYLLVRWLTFKLSFLVPLLISSYLFTFKSNLLIYRGIEIGFITNSRSFNIWKEKKWHLLNILICKDRIFRTNSFKVFFFFF